MEDSVDGLSAKDYVSNIASASDKFYGFNNLLIHNAISPGALSVFIPPVGESYVKMEMVEDIDPNNKSAFSLMNEEHGLYQLGCFKVTQEHDEDPVFVITLETVGDVVTVPSNEGFLVESLVMNPNGIYTLPEEKNTSNEEKSPPISEFIEEQRALRVAKYGKDA